MDSIFTPANLETNMRMKKEEIISNFRSTHMKNGTTHGTVEAFKNLFSASNPVFLVSTEQTLSDQRVLPRRQHLRGRGQRRRHPQRQRYPPSHAGILYLPNKDVYAGDWLNNTPNGNGVYIFENLERYEGSILQGKKNGQGAFFYKNGNVYRGDWANDVKKGTGEMSYFTGDS